MSVGRKLLRARRLRYALVEKYAAAVRRAEDLALKAQVFVIADHVEKAQIVRNARQIFRFDRLPQRHAARPQMPSPEIEQPTLVDRSNHVRARD
jgi:hypothetical protein